MMPWLWFVSALAGTLVDATGVEVRGDRTSRIVTLGGGVTETVFAVGAGGQVIGVDRTSLHPPAVQALPKVAVFRQLSAEGIVSLGPDLVVATEAAGPSSVIAQIQGAGIPVVRLSDDATIEAAKQRLRDVGTLLDRGDEAARAVATLDRDVESVQKPATPPRVLFIYARGAGTVQVAGTDTAADAMIRLAGGTNAIDRWTGYKPLTAEGAIAAQPDVILLTTRGLESMGGAPGLWRQPGMAVTPAGKASRLVTIEDSLLLGFGPRTGKAARALAEKLADDS